MIKKIFIGIGVLLLAIVLFFAYNIIFPKSPRASASINDRGLEVKVTYSQPSKRGRLIFGEAKDNPLQPFGKYWRLGANAATEITFNKNVNFAGKPVNAGSYRMYAIPGANSFQVVLNSELGVTFSAAGEPNHSLDLLTVDASTTEVPETEKFTISFSPDSLGVKMDCVWDKTKFTVPITPQ